MTGSVPFSAPRWSPVGPLTLASPLAAVSLSSTLNLGLTTDDMFFGAGDRDDR